MPDWSHVLKRFNRCYQRPDKPGYWQACCPCHDDRTPSLGIWVGDNGALVVRCWARNPECTPEAILAAVGLAFSDLYPDGARKNGKPKVERVVAATYVYRDEKGEPLYRVVRYKPKAFSQERHTPNGWTPGIEEVRRVLYRLPELLARPKAPVLVVEGEKDVETLGRMGFVATCNVGGTGMGWRDEYSEMLAGRRVTVIPDFDPPGYKHAYQVVGSLLHHGAASVRLCELPGLADKGDVTDFVGLHGKDAKDKLVAAVKACPEWTAPADKVAAC